MDIIKGACWKPEGILGWVTFTANQHVRKMGKKVLLAVVTGASLLNFSAGALDQSAPFGFSWGPVDKVPRPSLATRDENITRLTYFRDRLPPNELRDTEEIVLEVCKNRVFNKSFGLAGFFPKRRCATESKLFSPKACVDTESQRSQSKEL